MEFEVRLRIDAHHELVAVITRDSAISLGLAVGMEAHARIKSSSVLPLTDKDVRTSVRNQLWGEITRIHDGAVNCEVTLALPGGRGTLCSAHPRQRRAARARGGRRGLCRLRGLGRDPVRLQLNRRAP